MPARTTFDATPSGLHSPSPRGRPPRLCSAVAVHELGDPFDWLGAVERIRTEPYAWWLDSALVRPPQGVCSFAGADPYLVLRARGGRVDLECRRAARPDLPVGHSALEHDPFDVVRQLMPPPPAALDSACAAWPFLGGAVGWWGYELAEHVEPIELHGHDDIGLPDLALLFVDRVLAFDHTRGLASALGLGFGAEPEAATRAARAAADELAERVADLRDAAAPAPRAAAASFPADAPLPARIDAHFEEGTYAKTVASVIEEIAAGNVYQADLTQRLELRFDGDPWDLYGELRQLNPAPFAAYLSFPEVTVLSSSPERFVRVDTARRVESRPIKGTRPRGGDADEDARLRAELVASEKDRAENLMIVDLVRNDLGRVCETGSVEVPELMRVEDYAGVFQLVSSITGTLRADRDAVDLMRAAFPPGSMTGAPKLAAMRLLDRLEPVRRGIYSGAIGYLDLRGGLDLSVVIRTLVLARGRAFLHVGGGIVADSDPVGEYRETLDKARPLLAALSRSSGGDDVL